MESSTEKKHCHALLAFVGKTSWQQIKRIESQRVHQSQIHSIEILFSFILLSSIVYFLFCLTMQLLFGVIVVLFISATVVQSLRTTTATNKIVSSVDKLLLHSQIDKNEPVVRSVTALLHSNSDSNSHNCRKKKLGKTIGTIVTSLLLLTNSAPAFAAVGEGDLPEGVLAFRKVLKYQVLFLLVPVLLLLIMIRPFAVEHLLQRQCNCLQHCNCFQYCIYKMDNL